MKRPATIDSSVYKQTFYGILNAQGDFWTPLSFPSERKARQHILDFWCHDHDQRDWCLLRFKIVPVQVRLTQIADASAGRNAERQDAVERLGPKDEHAVSATSAETPSPSLRTHGEQ